jgi:hypothetical protein
VRKWEGRALEGSEMEVRRKVGREMVGTWEVKSEGKWNIK